MADQAQEELIIIDLTIIAFCPPALWVKVEFTLGLVDLAVKEAKLNRK